MQKRLIGDVGWSVDASCFRLFGFRCKEPSGQRKSREPSDRSKLHLPFPGFFGLLRNLRPAKRAGPDFGGLFSQLGCKCRFGNDGASAYGVTATNFGAKHTELRCSPRFGNDGVAVKMVRSTIA